MRLLKIVLNMVLVFCFFPMVAHAFMLGGTRVVLYQDKGSVSLSVISGKEDPLYLIRTRITRTLDDNQPMTAFLITPQLFRLEPGARNELRISLANPSALSSERESVFYLKVAGIPSSNPLNKDSKIGFTGAEIQFGTGNIIKLFYRPHGLGPVTLDSYRSIKYSRVPGGIKVTNPTPYHINFGSLKVDGVRVLIDKKQPAMVAPQSSRVYYFGGNTPKKEVAWRVLDDDGNVQSGISSLQ